MFYYDGMRGLLHIFLLLFPVYVALADATPVTCSHYNNSRADCNALTGCMVVEFGNNEFFCATQCSELSNETACNNYGGCKWDTNTGECGYYGSVNSSASDYNMYRAWDETEQQFIEAECPAEYPHAQPGTDSEDFCYKSCGNNSDTGTADCGFYKETTFWGGLRCIKSDTYTLIPTNTFHAEGDKCYLNTRPCNLFPLSVQGITSPVATNVTGDAIWDVENQQYNTNACRYSATTLNSELHCNQSIDYPGTATTNSATTQINYNSVSGSSYYCASCENATYYPTTAKPNTYHGCSNPNQNSYTACSCIKIEKGFYNSCSGGWDSNIQLSQCRTPCPVGQTTSNVGSTTISACQYGTDTKICDSTDRCVSLPTGTWTAIQ